MLIVWLWMGHVKQPKSLLHFVAADLWQRLEHMLMFGLLGLLLFLSS
jgi:hypothetical protein